ncbi:unnamed protein product [Heterosigma akashiwo]
MDNPHAPFGFFLVTMAGLSTAVGAGMVFSERMVKMASKRVLAGALSLSAGVMLYVSFAEIFVKSQIGFEDAGFSTSNAYLYATLSFFGGIAFGKTLDIPHHLLNSLFKHHFDLLLVNTAAGGGEREGARRRRTINISSGKKMKKNNYPEIRYIPSCIPNYTPNKSFSPGNAAVTSPDLTTLNLDKAGKTPAEGSAPGQNSGNKCATQCSTHVGALVKSKSNPAAGTPAQSSPAALPAPRRPPTWPPPKDARLVRMGVLTALAIGLHNFPEGLATFVATLDDPSVGGALAVAIAIHNVPEGLCVAIPIYYATGSRAKAFGWALVSGISEPIGAGLGWLVLSAVFSDVLYGVLFGLVAGMMVNICLHELIPTAHRHDPKDTIVSNCLVAGMAIMALSLVLFQY